ncbi:hypothetical protein KHX94_05310 [Shewanella dokdonensis]|uniref:Peptidase MA-like domain-containing protein n=1 Tax=Shewanella dokdonensis TaxID=712036 RepID=A0ABX8DHS8_9GAMM|nr:hypothetical protein [Shewanella dokdonensis]QVK24039.1 hypothetical protein KHX94_05310 [Shewanella dokdonensis]
MILAGLLTATLFWADVGPKQALVCPPAAITQCLAALPPKVRQQLPIDKTRYSDALALRAAMAIPVDDPSVAGIVLWAPEQLASSQSALWNGQVYQLSLQQQPLLTLWHELGHLEIKRLQGQLLPKRLTALEYEWLADCYMLWRSVRSSGKLTLAWQQYDRRNLGVISDIDNLSHWSSLYLLPVLTRYNASQIAAFPSFSDFVGDFFRRSRVTITTLLRSFLACCSGCLVLAACSRYPIICFGVVLLLAPS